MIILRNQNLREIHLSFDKIVYIQILEFIMTAPKQEAKKIIDSLPDDSSYDEILKELAFDRMIQKGLKNSKENKTISNQEMGNKIKQW